MSRKKKEANEIGTLHGDTLTPNVARVMVVANELHLKIKINHIDFTGASKDPTALLNPFGSLPVFVADDGTTLFESRAIAKYLDLRSGGHLLCTNDPKAFGKIEAWIAAETNYWTKHLSALYVERALKKKEDPLVVATNLEEFKKLLLVYENHFATTKLNYIAGRDVSMADLFHIPFACALIRGGYGYYPALLYDFPKVRAWYDRLRELPSWKEVEAEQQDLWTSTQVILFRVTTKSALQSATMANNKGHQQTGAGTIYGVVLSPNVARVFVVAHELKLKLTLNLIDLGGGDHKKEPFLSLNPFGTIPAFVSDDGVTLFESRAIARYLDLKTGGKLLHIKDPKAYGMIENWISVETSTWSKHAFPLFVEFIVKPKYRHQQPDTAIVATNRAEFAKTLQVYENHLTKANTTFIAGNDLSLADLFHVPFVVDIFFHADVLIDSEIVPLVDGPRPPVPDLFGPFPHVKAWFDRLVALPSWKAVELEQAEFIEWMSKKN